MTDTNETQESDAPQANDEEAKKEQMCCDGKRTAAEHRHESGDGKCCSD